MITPTFEIGWKWVTENHWHNFTCEISKFQLGIIIRGIQVVPMRTQTVVFVCVMMVCKEGQVHVYHTTSHILIESHVTDYFNNSYNSDCYYVYNHIWMFAALFLQFKKDRIQRKYIWKEIRNPYIWVVKTVYWYWMERCWFLI